jgi:AcrR family transcriptional regulator
MARTRDPALESARRAQVMDAVFELLSEGSWHAMTLQQVGRRAGVSKGLVTYHFASKDALIVAAIARFHQRYETSLTSIALSPLPVRERLEQLILAAFPSHDEVAREVRFQTEVWSFAKANPEVMAAVSQNYSQFRAATAALLQMGVAEGYVTTADPGGLYLFVQSLVDGLSIQVAYDPDLDLPAARARLLELLEVWFTA